MYAAMWTGLDHHFAHCRCLNFTVKCEMCWVWKHWHKRIFEDLWALLTTVTKAWSMSLNYWMRPLRMKLWLSVVIKHDDVQKHDLRLHNDVIINFNDLYNTNTVFRYWFIFPVRVWFEVWMDHFSNTFISICSHLSYHLDVHYSK